MIELVKYEAAIKAVEEARTTDEVKECINMAEAMKAYGRQAKDFRIENNGKEIRLRAERRLGELMKKQREGFGLNEGTKSQIRQKEGGGLRENPPEKQKPTLKEAGIDKNLADRARKAERMTKEEFEEKIIEIQSSPKFKRKDFFGVEIKTENKEYVLSIDNELQNRLEAMVKYLEKNIQEIEEIMQSQEYLRFTILRDYSIQFLLLGQKLLEFSKELNSPKLMG